MRRSAPSPPTKACYVGLADADDVVPADALALPEDPAALLDRSEAAPDRRPELRQLQRGVRAEELRGAIDKGERLPSVSVGAIALRHDFSGLNPYNDVLVYGTVTVPISAFWDKHHTIAAGEARAEVARTRLAETRKLVAIEIEKAWADLEAAYRAAQVAEATIEQSEVNGGAPRPGDGRRAPAGRALAGPVGSRLLPPVAGAVGGADAPEVSHPDQPIAGPDPRHRVRLPRRGGSAGHACGSRSC